MFLPLVSIIICTHNRSNLLRRAIESAINQSYDNIEIIISDDASTDNTKFVVESYQKQFQELNIIYRRNKINSGACYTRNKGIELAHGMFITGLDDDDSFEDNRIATFVENYNSEYSFICSNINVITKKGKYSLFSKKNRVIDYSKELWKNSVGNQIFIKRSVICDIGGFDDSLTSAQDIDLWLRILKKYGPAYMLGNASYNLYIDHDSPRITTSSRKLEGLRYFIEKHKANMSSSQLKYHMLRYEYWSNDRKFTLKLIRFLNVEVCVFLISILIDKMTKVIDERF